MVSGPHFFDDKDIFEIYWNRRKRPDNPNDVIEKPIMLELVDNVKYMDILELGCGGGDFGDLLLSMGCQSYTGIDASQRMIERAGKTLESPRATVVHGNFTAYDFVPAQYHLIISRLTLHYVAQLDDLFVRLKSALKPEGRFVFSVEHPVLTANNMATEKLDVFRDVWTVDNYFKSGRREVNWMGKTVIKYHRTLEEYIQLFMQTGYKLVTLRESKPLPQNFSNPHEYERRLRVPLYLFFVLESV